MSDLTESAIREWAELYDFALVPKEVGYDSLLGDCLAGYICDGWYVDEKTIQKCWEDLLKAAEGG